MTETPDLYEILGISPEAEQEVIRAAYRALMQKYHPDTSSSGDTIERAKLINDAYAVLKDPAKRAAYDRSRRAEQRPRADQSKPDNSASPESPEQARAKPQKINLQPHKAAPRKSVIKTHILIFIGLMTISLWAGFTIVEKEASRGSNSYAKGDQSSSLFNQLREQISPGPPPVNDLDLKEAAQLAWNTLSEGGITLARARSQDCHEQSAADWGKIDRCVAFDHIISSIDSSLAYDINMPVDTYFAQAAVAPESNYRSITPINRRLSERVQEIHTRAEPFFLEIIENE